MQESDPKAMNRQKKVAPMPEYSGKSLKESRLSGGGGAGKSQHGGGKNKSNIA